MWSGARLGLAPLALAVCAVGCGASASTSTRQHPAASTTAAGSGLHGLVPQPLPVKPGFTLMDTSGRRYNLRSRTAGKLTYLYFGYTHCPDVCPQTMGDLAVAIRQQPRPVRSRIRVVFVTVDPGRDTDTVLRQFLDHYSRAFVGLRGSPAQLRAAEVAAGVPVLPIRLTRHGNYAVSHSSFLLPFSPDNRAHVVYTQGFKPSDYAHDIPLLLRY